MTSPTAYTEANALLAAQDGDAATLAAIVAGMYSSERDRLEATCFTVIRALRNAP